MVSRDFKEAFDESQYLLMIKTLGKLEAQGKFLSLATDIRNMSLTS